MQTRLICALNATFGWLVDFIAAVTLVTAIYFGVDFVLSLVNA